MSLLARVTDLPGRTTGRVATAFRLSHGAADLGNAVANSMDGASSFDSDKKLARVFESTRASLVSTHAGRPSAHAPKSDWGETGGTLHVTDKEIG
jgi:hypothetical protein